MLRLVITKARFSADRFSFHHPLLMVTHGADCWHPHLGNTSVPALGSAVLHCWQWPWAQPGLRCHYGPCCLPLLALGSGTSQKKTHYCCPMRKAPSSFRPHQVLGIFSTILLSPISSNFHLCGEGADEKLQEGPHKTQAPSWPWQGQPAVALG